MSGLTYLAGDPTRKRGSVIWHLADHHWVNKMSSLVPDNWAIDERTRNVVMISALLLDYEPFWGTEKTLTKRRLDPCMLDIKSK